MTYIEFYDSISVVNICACLTNVPERVVLLGGEKKKMLEHADYYRRVFRSRGHEVEFDCRTVNKNDLQDIVKRLMEVVEDYPDCAVDLTGGEDLILVGMGIVYERCRAQGRILQMHRFNIRNNKILDCDRDGITIQKDLLQLTVEENLRINGGDIIYDTDREDATHLWDMDAEFLEDIDRMWAICREDPREWNIQTSQLYAAELLRQERDDPLETECFVSSLLFHLDENGHRFSAPQAFLKRLYAAGLLYFYDFDGEHLDVIYKNEQVKRVLTKAGLLLEMKVYATMLTMGEPDGTPTFNVMQGVFIDWDGRLSLQGEGLDTANEVDVIAMKGVVPVFISCKNGQFTSDELYKLQSVAERFGADHAKKVLIATCMDREHPTIQHFCQRAKDMKIRIIDDLTELSDREMEKLLRNIWQ